MSDEERGFRVRALGEIAIRCADLGSMVAFYRDVIGLEPLPGGSGDGIFFFRIAPSHGGHFAVLALFEPTAGRREIHPAGPPRPEAGAASSLHHLALVVPADEQDAVIGWYERQGLSYRVEAFDWIGWRGVFTTDPEGNTVELVAYVGRSED
ncbi:MAG: VOC family protein [Pseudomonadota bacterium]